MIQTLIEYDYQANLKYLNKLEELGVENKSYGSKHGTGLNLLDHILRAHIFMLNKLSDELTIEIDAKYKYDFSTGLSGVNMWDLKSVRKQIETNKTLLSGLAKNINEQKLWDKKDKSGMKIYDLFFHVLNHGTHHRGMIQLGLEVTGTHTDLSGYWQWLRDIS